MTIQLIHIINQIIKFGLESNLIINKNKRDLLLEKSLINIYSLYFDINYEFDDAKYKEYNEYRYAEIRKNVEHNFPDFGFYANAFDILNFENKDNFELGDAIDDLTDIILDLLQIKWRIENNSLNDGLWYFQLIFQDHTQQHIIDLLNYLKQRNKTNLLLS
ncbi:DUF5063 domain-containing protein [Chryseobacterium terrae]|uniref:DUF5063 domain-containing protein n=1 Tax=Chryseobacterium terrae TaxID=3163299 RepID=A0ABW8Y7J3_9FLAO